MTEENLHDTDSLLEASPKTHYISQLFSVVWQSTTPRVQTGLTELVVERFLVVHIDSLQHGKESLLSPDYVT